MITLSELSSKPAKSSVDPNEAAESDYRDEYRDFVRKVRMHLENDKDREEQQQTTGDLGINSLSGLSSLAR
jgi:hypothetical protein